MTDASGKPYPRETAAAHNGSMASMNTTMTTASSNGSTAASSVTVTRSPLRSSLKKPKQKDGLGIQNPGFSGTSPTLSRNGSTKKVRIQTHSTEVWMKKDKGPRFLLWTIRPYTGPIKTWLPDSSTHELVTERQQSNGMLSCDN